MIENPGASTTDGTFDPRSERVILAAAQRFADEGRNCAEMTFLGVGQVFDSGFDADLIRLATPFGGGIGGREDACGALIGGCMAIGYFLGRGDMDPEQTHCREVTGAYYDWFEAHMGFTKCGDRMCGTHGLGKDDRCTPIVEESIRALVSTLLEDGLTLPE